MREKKKKQKSELKHSYKHTDQRNVRTKGKAEGRTENTKKTEEKLGEKGNPCSKTRGCKVTDNAGMSGVTRRVGQRCTENLSRAPTSSRWCSAVVRRGGASSGVVLVT
ncbi:hypothetical protein TNCV_496311 [Trichonephila clavipes]|nr:hypothetical protein TNCV_496311 [Trichonephila clavipes]